MKQIVNKALVALSITIVGISLIPVSISFDYDYDEEKETLRFESPSGRVYEYHDVPKTIYEELKKSPQPVQYDLKAQKDQIKVQKDLKAQKDQIKAQKDQIKAQKYQIQNLEDKLKVAKRKALVRGCGGQDEVDYTQHHAYIFYEEIRNNSPRMYHEQAEAWTKFYLKRRPKSKGLCREAIDHLIDWRGILIKWRNLN